MKKYLIIILIILFPGITQAETYGEIHPDGTYSIQGLWHLNADDSTPDDSSGNAYHGTTVSGATFTETGKFGGSYSFDGTNDYIESTSFVQPTTNLSVSLWVKASTTPANFDSPSGNTDGAWTNGAWAFHYSGGDIRFWIQEYTIYASVTYATMTDWHHFVGTWDGSTIRIYMDGEEGTPQAYTGSMTTKSSFRIGATIGSGARNFPGTIDEVCIWDRVLSADEIRQYYAQTQGAYGVITE